MEVDTTDSKVGRKRKSCNYCHKHHLSCDGQAKCTAKLQKIKVKFACQGITNQSTLEYVKFKYGNGAGFINTQTPTSSYTYDLFNQFGKKIGFWVCVPSSSYTIFSSSCQKLSDNPTCVDCKALEQKFADEKS